MGKSKILSGGAIDFVGSNAEYPAGETLKRGDYVTLAPVSTSGGANYGPGEVKTAVPCVGNIAGETLMAWSESNVLYFYAEGKTMLSYAAAGYPLAVIDCENNTACVLVGRSIYIDAYFITLSDELAVAKAQTNAMSNTLSACTFNYTQPISQNVRLVQIEASKWVLSLIAYNDTLFSYKYYAFVFTISGQVVSAGSAVEIPRALNAAALVPGTNQILSINHNNVYLFTVSGMSISYTSIGTNMPSNYYFQHAWLFHISGNRYALVWNGSANGVYCVIVTFSGSAVTYDTAVQISTTLLGESAGVCFGTTVLFCTGYYTGSVQRPYQYFILDVSGTPTLLSSGNLPENVSPRSSYGSGITQILPGYAEYVAADASGPYSKRWFIRYVPSIIKAENVGVALKNVPAGGVAKVNIKL